MRNIIIFVIGIALFAPHAYANDCGLPKRPAGRSAPPLTVHCADCESVYDFAFHGAGSLHKSSSDRIWVTGSQGSKVSVTTDRPMIPGISFKGIGVPDFSRQLVTAHDLNGKATGDPLSDMVFPSHVLAAKCKQLEEKEKEAIKEMREKLANALSIRNTESVKRIEGESIQKQLDSMWLHWVIIGDGTSPGECWPIPDGVKCKPDSKTRRQ